MGVKHTEFMVSKWQLTKELGTTSFRFYTDPDGTPTLRYDSYKYSIETPIQVELTVLSRELALLIKRQES